MDHCRCPACEATPETITEGKAQLAIVRHKPGCPTLLAQTRARWPDQPTKLPDTPNPQPFARLAARDRHGRNIHEHQQRRRSLGASIGGP